MRSKSLRAGIVVAAVAALTLGVVGVAGGQNGDRALSLSASVVFHGDVLIFGSADNEDSLCESANAIWSIVDADDETRVMAGPEFTPTDQDGNWVAEWVVPEWVVPGTYVIGANCGGSDPYPPAFFEVAGDIEPLQPIIPDELPLEPIEAAPRFTG